MINRSDDNTSALSSTPQTTRVFIVTGLMSGLWRVAVATTALLYLVGLWLAISIQPFGAKVPAAVSTIDLSDAWGFLTVLSALTIAAQVSASSNHQQRDSFARRRAPRFNNLAAATGAVAIVGWIFLFARFQGTEPGALALITVSTAGIVFFAADAATMIVRADQRDSLEIRQWRRLRWNVPVVRRELKRAVKFPAGYLLGCVLIAALWSAAITLAYAGAIVIAEPTQTAKSTPGSVLSQLLAIWLFVGTIAAIAITLTVLIAALRLGKISKPNLAGTRVLVVLIGLLLCSVPVAVAIQPNSSGLPPLVIISAVALPIVVTLGALSPLVALRRGSKAFWTPRGSLRVGYAAIVGIQLQILKTSRMDLEAAISAEQAGQLNDPVETR
ncbi:hypothetical protein [Leifsonia sp. Leaf336]|uniref:hypothetical protein n=1 Tax=Leifsonia sp. Leaf336 TaxID=1736341 RepID=UPI000A41F59F|nr:hypothetical protein [Leifsonia sp. Leaf336]